MPTVSPSSIELLARVATSRDADAWSELLTRHGAAMHRSAMAITSSADRADDAMQEALLHLRQRADRFRGAPPGVDAETAVRHWLQRLASNAALQLLRAERRRKRHEGRTTSLLAPHEEAAMQPSCEPVQLSAALARLSKSDRQAILLRYVEGLDGHALANALGCAASAARVRLHRAMTRLRGHLAAAGVLLTLPLLAARLDAAAITWSQPPSAATSTGWTNLLSSATTPCLPFHHLTGALSPMTIAACAAAIPLLATSLFYVAHLSAGEAAPAPIPPLVVAPGQSPSPPTTKPEKSSSSAVAATLDEQLKMLVSFDFQDKPIRDVVLFFKQATGIDIVISPTQMQEISEMTMTLTVKDMEASKALQFIERLSGLDHHTQEQRYTIVLAQ